LRRTLVVLCRDGWHHTRHILLAVDYLRKEEPSSTYTQGCENEIRIYSLRPSPLLIKTSWPRNLESAVASYRINLLQAHLHSVLFHVAARLYETSTTPSSGSSTRFAHVHHSQRIRHHRQQFVQRQFQL